jgi:S-adenosylmethionine decarboxylase
MLLIAIAPILRNIMPKATERKSPRRAYGLHLLLDGYGASSKRLADVGLLYKILNTLPEKIGMTKVGFPHIIQFTKAPIAGISGFIFIVESHISIHTYSKQRFISVDIYSCRQFKPDKAVQFLQKVYSIETWETHLVRRGRYFYS